MRFTNSYKRGRQQMNIDSRNIPVGISDFDALISGNGKYIDKTSYLESLLDSSTAVHLL